MLRGLLNSMTAYPGVANPDNPIAPLGHLKRLRFARFLIIEDSPPTMAL